MKLAVYLTPHGYGHMTRTLEVIRELKMLKPDVVVHVRAKLPVAAVRNALGFSPNTHDPVQLDLGLVQIDSLGSNLDASVERLSRFFGPEGERRMEAEARWLDRNFIDAAILDIPPRGFDACALAGVPSYGLTNFSWDDIWRDLAEEDPRLRIFADRASEAYGKCTLLFRTVMNFGLEAFPNKEEVPLVARISQLDPEETRRMFKIPSDKPVVMLSFGGEGLDGVQLPDRALHDHFRFIVTEPLADPGDPFHYISNANINENGVRYCDLVRAADIVMTKPGYSTIAECVANRTAIVYTDRSRFAEYEGNVAYIRASAPNAFLSSTDLKNGEWGAALEAVAAKMPFKFPEIRTDGARLVAERLMDLIRK